MKFICPRKIVRRVLRVIACLVMCCGMANAEFADSVDVKDKTHFVEAMMRMFKTLKPGSESFASYGRRGPAPLSEMVSIGTENKIPVIYVEVFHEISMDHGERANELVYLVEFPVKTRVDKPKLSYRVDATKVSQLAKWQPQSISMISKCVREVKTKRVTWVASYLRIAFDNEKDMEDYLKSFSSLLFGKDSRNADGYVTLTNNPF